LQRIGALVGSPDTAIGLAGSADVRSGGGAAPFHQAWSRPLDAACGRVEIWFVAAGAHRLLAQDARVLSPEDWSAIARVRDEAGRNHLRATRITLRRALSHAVGGAVKPAAWRFQTTSYGKPQVAPGQPEVQFCISHIDTMSVIAVSRDAPVGVDIETVASPGSDKLVESFCSARERQALARLDEPARARAFAWLWTLKEAYAKLTGTGLAADFRFLEFGTGPELHTAGYQTQHVPGGASFQSWLTEAPGGLCQVTVAVGDTNAVAERGELVCFVVRDAAAAQSRTLNPGHGEQAGLALS
jgi:4'-phosphopantetheinyl transferase